MTNDTNMFITKFLDFQIHSNVYVLLPTDLMSITSPWLFFQWEIDIVGPFLKAPGRLKFLIIVIDYFTKWVEAEVVATITRKKTMKFVWKQIICRFGLPHTIISDNGKRFVENPFKRRSIEKGIKHNFTSVAHPQANGQLKVRNRTLVKGYQEKARER